MKMALKLFLTTIFLLPFVLCNSLSAAGNDDENNPELCDYCHSNPCTQCPDCGAIHNKCVPCNTCQAIHCKNPYPKCSKCNGHCTAYCTTCQGHCNDICTTCQAKHCPRKDEGPCNFSPCNGGHCNYYCDTCQGHCNDICPTCKTKHCPKKDEGPCNQSPCNGLHCKYYCSKCNGHCNLLCDKQHIHCNKICGECGPNIHCIWPCEFDGPSKCKLHCKQICRECQMQHCRYICGTCGKQHCCTRNICTGHCAKKCNRCSPQIGHCLKWCDKCNYHCWYICNQEDCGGKHCKKICYKCSSNGTHCKRQCTDGNCGLHCRYYCTNSACNGHCKDICVECGRFHGCSLRCYVGCNGRHHKECPKCHLCESLCQGHSDDPNNHDDGTGHRHDLDKSTDCDYEYLNAGTLHPFNGGDIAELTRVLTSAPIGKDTCTVTKACACGKSTQQTQHLHEDNNESKIVKYMVCPICHGGEKLAQHWARGAGVSASKSFVHAAVSISNTSRFRSAIHSPRHWIMDLMIRGIR